MKAAIHFPLGMKIAAKNAKEREEKNLYPWVPWRCKLCLSPFLSPWRCKICLSPFLSPSNYGIPLPQTCRNWNPPKGFSLESSGSFPGERETWDRPIFWPVHSTL
jgi:hypothetical protein